MKVPKVPVKETLAAARKAARDARDAVNEARERLKAFVENRPPDIGDDHPDFEAAEIALDELHGAEEALASVEGRLRKDTTVDESAGSE